METSFTGIVIRSIKYDDNRIIVEVLTKERGLMSFIATISRSKKAKLKPSYFQPASIISFSAEVKPHRRLSKIINCQIETFTYELIVDPIKRSIVFFLCEVLHNVLTEDIKDDCLYEFIHSSLLTLDIKESQFANFHIIFILKLYIYIGISPDYDSYREGFCLDLLEGKFKPRAVGDVKFLASERVSSLIYEFSILNYASMQECLLSSRERNTLVRVLLDYFKAHLPIFRDTKSLGVLEELYS